MCSMSAGERRRRPIRTPTVGLGVSGGLCAEEKGGTHGGCLGGRGISWSRRSFVWS